MGLGLSFPAELDEDWQLDPTLPGVQSLGKLFFVPGGRSWDSEAAALIRLVHARVAPAASSVGSEAALGDAAWWAQHVAPADPNAAKVVFDLMAVDAAGTKLNLYELVSCAAMLSPHLANDTKIAILFGLWTTSEDASLGVEEVSSFIGSLFLGLHRLAVLASSPPQGEDIESEVCRLLWILRKHQPYRSDGLAFEEILLVAELDAGVRHFLNVFQGSEQVAQQQTFSGVASSRERPEWPQVATVSGSVGSVCCASAASSVSSGPKTRSTAASNPPAPSGRKGTAAQPTAAGVGRAAAAPRAGSQRPHQEGKRRQDQAPATASSASSVLSRKEVLEAFDVFRELREEQDRLRRRNSVQPLPPREGEEQTQQQPQAPPNLARFSRALAKVKNAQVELAVKRMHGKGQSLELRDFLRMLAVSKAPAAFAEAYLDFFEAWIVERAQLSEAELARYGVTDRGSVATSSPRDRGDARGRRCTAPPSHRVRVLQQRARSPEMVAVLQKKRAARQGEKRGAPGDLELTLNEMVNYEVVPGELAAAAARTFAWDVHHIVTEGTFLELFVPCAPNDYHALDFMRGFRQAWLMVNRQSDADKGKQELLSPTGQSSLDESMLFGNTQDLGDDGDRPMELQPYSEPVVVSTPPQETGLLDSASTSAGAYANVKVPASPGVLKGSGLASEREDEVAYENDDFDDLSEADVPALECGENAEEDEEVVSYEEIVRRSTSSFRPFSGGDSRGFASQTDMS